MNNTSCNRNLSAQPALMLHCPAGSGRQWDGLAAMPADHDRPR